jgi:hypothetical protein
MDSGSLRSSYSEDSQQAGKSSGPQNLVSLSTLQRLNLEAPWGGGVGLNLTFFTLSARGSTVVFIGVRRSSRWRLGMWGTLVRPADQAIWSGVQVSSLHHHWALDTLSTTSFGHVDKMVFGNAPIHGQLVKVIWQPATPWLGWARALCHIISSCHIFCDYALFST